MNQRDPLSGLFEALSDPTRRAILSRLAVEGLTPQQISEALELTPGEVIVHLGLLEATGLLMPDASAGPGALRLHSDGIVLLENWLSWFRRFRIDSHDRLRSIVQDVGDEVRRSDDGG